MAKIFAACPLKKRILSAPENGWNVQERLERFGRLLGEAASWRRQSQRSQLAGMASEQAEQSLFDLHDCPAKAELMTLSRGIFYPVQPVQ